MPFRDAYIHGLVLDENGKKMSKTANNGINPLLIDKYGTDALLHLSEEVAGAGQDIRLEYNRKTDESASASAILLTNCGTLPVCDDEFDGQPRNNSVNLMQT